ncbi:MAG: hypothetical protein Q4D96_12130 [Propionibacteriaceae bacterium]|nr:hypothetical protein [Propionibacteriaceae bacterium]
MMLRGVGRVTLGAAVILSAALGVTGCAQHEHSAEQAPGEPVVAKDGSGPRIPEGYQSDDCPLPAGELVSAIGRDDTYVLTYTVEDVAAFERLLERYDTLGYERVSTEEPGKARASTLRNGRWEVNLAYPEMAGFTLIVTAKLIS